MLSPLFLALAWMASQGLPLAQAGLAPNPAKHVKAELVAAREGTRPGGMIWVGLKLKLEKGWHVYWKNPGDTGLPPRMNWKSLGGAQAGELKWPIPKRFLVGRYINLGYEDQVLLPFQLRAPLDLLPGKSITLTAEARWLVCRESCVPERAELSLELPAVGARQDSASESAGLFTETLKHVPEEASEKDWEVTLESVDSAWHMKAKPHFPVGDLAALSHELQVLPEDKGLANLAPLSLTASADALEISLPRATPLQTDGKNQFSVVLASNSQHAWPVHPGLRALAIRLTAPLPKIALLSEASAAPLAQDAPFGLTEMLLLAFLGGLILNLMPCVFPVLSIKVLDFVSHPHQNARTTRLKAGLYTAGVILTFWTLAGMLLLFQKAGQQVGWGFQLQAPGFVASLILLFFLMGLNLLGTFEIGTRLMGAGGKLGDGAGLLAAFFTGVLSVVVASPCTAPFMGVALGFALSQSAAVALTVFTALGLGLASPFLVLISFPSLVKRLPRPGLWMSTIKKFLSFPLFASVAWLIWVFDLQVGSAGLVRVLSALVVLGMAAWIYGEWAQQGRTLRARRAGLVATAILIIAVAALIDAAVKPRSLAGIQWEPYSAARVESLRAQGIPVFVDFTAAWCITCQVNEQVALSSDEISHAFLEKKVVALRGDWTHEDPEITRVLKQFGRSGVPLYLVYGKNQPQVLPQLLTPTSVLKALEGL